MSPTPDHEEELRRALQQQAGGVEVVTDFAPGAIARRRRDHRNRLVLAACACVATAAVAVPTLWAANRPDIVPGPARPTTSAPTNRPSTPAKSPTPTPSTPEPSASTRSGSTAPSAPSTTPAPSAPSTSSVNPAMAYAVGNVLHLGPATVTLPKNATVEKFSRLQGGSVVVAWRAGSGIARTQVLDARGRELVDLGETGQWLVSRDRARVVWSDGQVVKMLDSAGKVVATRRTALTPIDIVADDVYLAGANTAQQWNVTTGRTTAMPKGLAAVAPSRARGVVVYAESLDSQNVCWALVDLTSTSFTRLVEKCPATFVPRGFSTKGTYLVGDSGADGGFFSQFVIVRADTGKPVFGAATSSVREGAGWSMHLDTDERTLWLSANTSRPRFPAKTNTVQQCTIGGSCTDTTPPLGTPRSQPRYVVESPSSD